MLRVWIFLVFACKLLLCKVVCKISIVLVFEGCRTSLTVPLRIKFHALWLDGFKWAFKLLSNTGCCEIRCFKKPHTVKGSA